MMTIPGDPLPISPARWTDTQTGRPTDPFYQYIFKLDDFVGTNITRLLGIQSISVLLNTLAASSSASLDDTISITNAYDLYMIEFVNVIPATNNAGLKMLYQVSGVFQTTSYLSSIFVANSAATTGVEASTTGIILTGQGAVTAGIDNTALGGVSGIVWLFGPNNSNFKRSHGLTDWLVSATIQFGGMCGGFYNGSAAAVTGLRFQMSSGNIASGIVRIYGIKTS